MANLLLSRAQIFWVIIFLFLYTFILLGNYCIFIFICLIAPQRPALLSSLSGNLISPCVQDTGTSTPALGGRTKLTEHNFLHIFWANHNELYCSHKRPIPIMTTSIVLHTVFSESRKGTKMPLISDNFWCKMNFANAGIGAGCEGLSRVIQIRQVHGPWETHSLSSDE